jgi:hypothetical protein
VLLRLRIASLDFSLVEGRSQKLQGFVKKSDHLDVAPFLRAKVAVMLLPRVARDYRSTSDERACNAS